MTDTKTYKLKGHTVKVVPDYENPGRTCHGCVFHGKNHCPSLHEEASAGLTLSCVEGGHYYVEVQQA